VVAGVVLGGERGGGGRNTATPGIANTAIVVSPGERTLGAVTRDSRAKNAGASVPIDAATRACMAMATAMFEA
jgi:hypothetical protein